MRIAVALATASIVALYSVQGSAAPHWVKWREGFSVDMNSVARSGTYLTFDVIPAGDDDPNKVARNPVVHLKNFINCVTHTHKVYTPFNQLWSAEGKWAPEEEPLFTSICNLKH
jgi:hypothetical protein